MNAMTAGPVEGKTWGIWGGKKGKLGKWEIHGSRKKPSGRMNRFVL